MMSDAEVKAFAAWVLRKTGARQPLGDCRVALMLAKGTVAVIEKGRALMAERRKGTTPVGGQRP